MNLRSLLDATAERLNEKFGDRTVDVSWFDNSDVYQEIKAFIRAEQLSLLAAVKDMAEGMIETGEPEVGIFLNAEEQAYNDALIDLIKQLEVTDTPT